MDSDASSLTTAADDMVSNAILGALLGSDRTQLQDESEVSDNTPAGAADTADGAVAKTLDNVVPEHLSLMKGSLDTADWTAFDELAEQSGDIDDALNWSLVVSLESVLYWCLHVLAVILQESQSFLQ